MNEQDELHKRSLNIIKALDYAIEKGPWEASLFLRAMGKKLEDLRDRFAKSSGLDEQLDPDLVEEEQHALLRAQANQTEIFISLYNADGLNMLKWEHALSTLANQTVSRATYSDESSVQAMIRSRPNKNNEAYIVAFINNEDIIKPVGDIPPKDKLGNELLSVKNGAIKSDNIARFVHATGLYRYARGKLVLEKSTQGE